MADDYCLERDVKAHMVFEKSSHTSRIDASMPLYCTCIHKHVAVEQATECLVKTFEDCQPAGFTELGAGF